MIGCWTLRNIRYAAVAMLQHGNGVVYKMEVRIPEI